MIILGCDHRRGAIFLAPGDPRDGSWHCYACGAFVADDTDGPKLDGCTCRPVRGSHRPDCPWSAIHPNPHKEQS
jgi:hypothetical protein